MDLDPIVQSQLKKDLMKVGFSIVHTSKNSNSQLGEVSLTDDFLKKD